MSRPHRRSRKGDEWKAPTPELLEILNKEAQEGAFAATLDPEINEIFSPADILKVTNNRNKILNIIDKAIQDPDLPLHYLKQTRAALIIIRYMINSQIKVFDERIKRAEAAGEPDEEAPRDCKTCEDFEECKGMNEELIRRIEEDPDFINEYPTGQAALDGARAWLEDPTHEKYSEIGDLLKPIEGAIQREKADILKKLINDLKSNAEQEEEEEEEEEDPAEFEEDCRRCEKYPVCVGVVEATKEILTEAGEVYQAPTAQAALDAIKAWEEDPDEEKHQAAGKLLKQALKEIPEEAARRLSRRGEDAEKDAILNFLKLMKKKAGEGEE